MHRKKLVLAISKWFGLSVGFIGTQAVQAGDLITVDSISDQPETGMTTFREAIITANSSSGVTIEFDESLFSEPQTIILEQGELTISSSTTINGPGADLLTIDGVDNSRILRLSDEDSTVIQAVEINGITLTGGNGKSPADSRSGGCILSFESLSINESTVTGCTSSGRGGGVYSRFGSLTLNNTTVSDNRAGNQGGGISVRENDVLITNSTITNNVDIGFAGLNLVRQNNVEIINSTFSNNQPAGIKTESSSQTLHVINSTVVNNSDIGIDIKVNTRVSLSNSIVAGNSVADCDFSAINNASIIHNNLDTDGSCNVLANNHLTVDDPLLEALAFYGGSTQTHRPQSNSPVIDAGDDSLCEAFDQRGQVRPQDGDANGSAVCDIGAVELGVSDDIIFTNGFDVTFKN